MSRSMLSRNESKDSTFEDKSRQESSNPVSQQELSDKEVAELEKIGFTVMVCIQAFLTLFSFVLVLKRGLFQLPSHEMLVVIALDLLAEVILLMISFSIVRGSQLENNIRRTFMFLVFTTGVYLFVDIPSWLVDGYGNLRALNIALSSIFYAGSMTICWIYTRFLREWLDVANRVWDIALLTAYIVDIILIVGNIRGHYFFYVTEDGFYMRSPTYFLCLVIPICTLLACCISVFRVNTTFMEKIILAMFPLAPMIGTTITVRANVPTIIGIEVFASIVFIYTNLYVKRERELSERDLQIYEQNVKLEKQKLHIAEQQNKLQESRIEITKLQLNPHFIYNTLGTIAALCMEDPEQAETLTMNFSSYLRDNFGQKYDRMMVPFMEEIENLEHYLAIEVIRYPDIIIRTDYKACNFMIPGLSLQPLVENAINHGIRMKKDGGRIIVTSREENDEYIITVVDNGIGFKGVPEDGRKHIGIANVRYRIETLCGGSLDLIGEEGVGTTAVIRIPKQEQETNNML